MDDEPILYIGNGWKSPFPSNKKWLFGVPGMKVLCLCIALWVRKCQALHLEAARKAWWLCCGGCTKTWYKSCWIWADKIQLPFKPIIYNVQCCCLKAHGSSMIFILLEFLLPTKILEAHESWLFHWWMRHIFCNDSVSKLFWGWGLPVQNNTQAAIDGQWAQFLIVMMELTTPMIGGFLLCVVGMGIRECNCLGFDRLVEYGNMFIRMQLNTVILCDMILYYLIQKIQEGFMKIDENCQFQSLWCCGFGWCGAVPDFIRHETTHNCIYDQSGQL